MARTRWSFRWRESTKANISHGIPPRAPVQALSLERYHTCFEIEDSNAFLHYADTLETTRRNKLGHHSISRHLMLHLGRICAGGEDLGLDRGSFPERWSTFDGDQPGWHSAVLVLLPQVYPNSPGVHSLSPHTLSVTPVIEHPESVLGTDHRVGWA